MTGLTVGNTSLSSLEWMVSGTVEEQFIWEYALNLGYLRRSYAGHMHCTSRLKRHPGRQRVNYLTYVRKMLGDAEGDQSPEAIAARAADRKSWMRLVVDSAAVGG